MKGLVWFREDLRVRDNTALYHASIACNDGIIGIYIIDPSLWKKHHVAACRKEFSLGGLSELRKSLNERGIPLLIKTVKHTSAIPKLIGHCMKKSKLDRLFYNRQYEFNESQRDHLVCHYLEKQGISCQNYDDQLILRPGTVLTKSGSYFSVFTPFKRAWIRELMSNKKGIKLSPIPKKQKITSIESAKIPKKITGFTANVRWPSGEKEAKRRLKQFIENGLFNYHKYCDFPALAGTSQLSPYLSAGMISPRQCFLAALIANDYGLEHGHKGAIKWMNELIWREFYKHLLVAIPRLSMNKPYRLNTDKLKWRFNKKKLLAWQQGKTGYPIVDAGMRQLNQIGWMHNRLRMVVAMFFTKNLFFDWRIGEDYFMRQLIDGDLAANNGGWQWSASTGTDAVPYFRIFNPIRQSERFDPKGNFIRTYCPELKDLDARAIHDPHTRAPELAKLCGYPLPIVDINISRRSTIKAYKMI
ncbi:MAG: deoxyribodipyrimidine photo-lyase [Rickettsiella sp.]|nr:deoxyribodipyrimidine photo-lyase [Rickettsiella sp.]